MNERDRQALDDIVEFAERAARLVGHHPFESFVADEAVLYAVRYCILVIGETANDLSSEAKAEVPGIPWPEIIAMRHRLAHNYRAITDRIVYDTVAEDIPLLLEAINAAMNPNRE
jgi:uncharacterized protein with HEPN domain